MKKNRSRFRGRNPTSIPVIDALIGEEEQTGKKKRERKKETGEGSPTQLPWTLRSPPTEDIWYNVGSG